MRMRRELRKELKIDFIDDGCYMNNRYMYEYNRNV